MNQHETSGREKPFLLAIGGKSGSGKTILAKNVCLAMADLMPLELALDRYYVDLAHLPFEERCSNNFDLPNAMDWPLIELQLQALKQGRSVSLPVYDFCNHIRCARVEPIIPGGLVVIEGIFALDPHIRKYHDAAVFIDVPDPIALERRMDRDVCERGRSQESVIKQYMDQVQPAFDVHVAPTRFQADLLLQGEDPLDQLSGRVVRMVREKMANGRP